MKTVGIRTSILSAGHRRIFDIFGELLNIKFVTGSIGNSLKVDAWLLQEADTEDYHRILKTDCPCYAILCGDQLIESGEASLIEFSANFLVMKYLRGRKVELDEPVRVKALPRWLLRNVTVLATKGGAAIWAMKECGKENHYFVTNSIPELSENEPLFELFHGKYFWDLLPLWLFLHSLTNDPRWEPPPLQASFQFDDPNLHWRTYGFIDFEKLAKHAREKHYHVSFATIPLDNWFFHSPTAALFKKKDKQLSLLVHGNDHIANELYRPCNDKERNQILRHALFRTKKLELRSGVEVSKVMAPPHGKCGANFIKEMAQVGFEAACIPTGALRRFNGAVKRFETIGMRPSEIIEGLPVVSRFPISKRCHKRILIATLLHQPIIPVGHHYDLADGLEILEDLAKFINSMGDVRWASMEQISRSHYARMFDQELLHIRMYTKRIQICVPEGIRNIKIDRSLHGKHATLEWRVFNENAEWIPQQSNEPISVKSGKYIEITINRIRSSAGNIKIDRKIRCWPPIRRLLTEARDRLNPLLRRLPR